jgi:hypothetical protein
VIGDGVGEEPPKVEDESEDEEEGFADGRVLRNLNSHEQ